MSNIAEILPNLTHTEISIQDRLRNITLMKSNVSFTTRQGDTLSQHIITECLRVVIMAIKYPSDITREENMHINDILDNPKYLGRSYAELIVDHMVSEDLPVKQIVDIINYFNKIIPIGELEKDPPSNWPRIHRRITVDTLLMQCEQSIRMNYKESVMKIHELIDVIRNVAYVRNAIGIDNGNKRLITNGHCSKMTIRKRFKYTKQLQKKLRSCLITDIPLLMDRIVVEKFRIHCMSLVMSEIPLYLSDIIEPHRSLIDYSDFMMEVLYYFDSQYNISSNLYIDIMDILKYHNYLVEYIFENDNNEHPYVNIKYINKHWFGDTSDIIEYIKMQFRVDTINELIS